MSKMKTTDRSVDRASKRRKLSQSKPDQPLPDQDKKVSRVERSADEDESAKSAKVHASKPLDLPSIKDLASSDSSRRRACFKTLQKHLEDRPNKAPLSHHDCLQLWRGMFVAVYMHDSKNTISVQNLLKDIASTFSIISTKDDYGEDSWLTPYHQAFHETLIREWSSIDSHRMNKYLLLVRFVVREIFTICFRPLFSTRTAEKDQLPEKREEEGTIEARHRAKSIMGTMEASGPLNRTDRKIPDGLRLHLLDVFPEELFTAYTAAEEGSATTGEDAALNAPDQHILGMMLEVFKAPITAMAESNSGAQKHVRQRAKEALQHLAEREAEAFESIGG